MRRRRSRQVAQPPWDRARQNVAPVEYAGVVLVISPGRAKLVLFYYNHKLGPLGQLKIRTEGRPFHMSMSKILITGGAGFIGSNFVLQQIRDEAMPIVNLDRLTYAGNLRNLDSLADHKRHTFVHGDIA